MGESGDNTPDAGKAPRHGWARGHWKKLTALAVLLAAFLGWYHDIREKGRLFVCDAAQLAGQGEAIPFCREEPDESDQLARLEYLRERKDQLTPAQRAQFEQLERHFIDRALAQAARAPAAL